MQYTATITGKIKNRLSNVDNEAITNTCRFAIQSLYSIFLNHQMNYVFLTIDGNEYVYHVTTYTCRPRMKLSKLPGSIDRFLKMLIELC